MPHSVFMVWLCRPFDAATYEDEVDDDDVMDEEGRTRLKLKVSVTVRGADQPYTFSPQLTRKPSCR